ncbi:hypothetical protein ABB37_01798 [Leptomonas pyrrhocoris]|uniref:Uncharacterized protein n=1 Tax=Leptomonas pyrrhocoris TaxID=157538 RepID=A0A0N0VHK7_LEPPY|nr:hypothetical protein ABB37_01798 [Leptomonas pyrrhocoris]KPA85524.1 hypothetical protein ABB37_01798 [Leptomonas pyrrhocoris]|eukprot:XP_015663963.1 hypothetical protein ABB37_01798 [Leptomonas pyrrhocoris]
MRQRFDFPGTQNLQMMVDNAVLYLYCDLSRSLGASTSGRSVLISSSSGNKPLGKSGAFLGFNVFTKSLEKRDLTNAGIGALLTDDFTAVGDGCQWRIEKDEKTLCVKIDFSKVTARAAASGKSMLLATTSGNRSIADSGLSCGLNCYYPTSETFTVAQLAEGASPADELHVGHCADLDGGFKVTYVAANKMTLQYTYRTEDMADGHVASMPAFRLKDLTVMLYVAAVKAARARTESVSMSPASLQSQGSTGAHGDFLKEDGKEDKVRNVVVACTPTSAAEAYNLEFTFDPTKNYGRSSSGKSLTVASTGGFQRVVDREGRVVCRVSLNGYRPTPPVADDEIATAVEKVLSAKEEASLGELSFKDVLAEVMRELGAGEAMKEALRARVKGEVATYLKRVSSP